MRKKGHLGSSMGTIIKKKNKLDPKAVNCSNCKHLFRGICRQLDKISGGKLKYISDKRAARKCKFYVNKHTQDASSKTNTGNQK